MTPIQALPRCIAEEHAQEAWLRTWRRGGVRQPGGYEHTVRRHLAIDWLRRQRTEPYEDGAPGRACSRWREESLDALRLRQLLAQAPTAYRDVLVRLYLVEASVSDVVADLAGGPRQVVGEAAWSRARDLVYKRRRRGLAWLRERM